MLISKKRYDNWREIQDEYDAYMTSFGPWNQDALIEFFEVDWGNDETRWPFTRVEIKAFMDSDEEVLKS